MLPHDKQCFTCINWGNKSSLMNGKEMMKRCTYRRKRWKSRRGRRSRRRIVHGSIMLFPSFYEKHVTLSCLANSYFTLMLSVMLYILQILLYIIHRMWVTSHWLFMREIMRFCRCRVSYLNVDCNNPSHLLYPLLSNVIQTFSYSDCHWSHSCKHQWNCNSGWPSPCEHSFTPAELWGDSTDWKLWP